MPEGTAKGLELLDPGSARVFLLGEEHGVAVNYPLDFALLRYFHAKADVRTYLSEISHAHAWWLNRFLRTGDESILDRLLGDMRGFVDCSWERREFFVRLRSWNQSLAPSEQVTVIGFDLERMPGISFSCLEELLRGKTAPAELAAVVEPLRSLRGISPANATASVEAIGASLEKQHTAFAAWLGEEALFDFALVIDNLRDRYRCMADRAQFDQKRDQVMADNFARLSKQKAFERAYGRAGSAHVLQKATAQIDHLSSLLVRPDSLGRGNVIGIWPLYANSTHLSFKQGQSGSTACTEDQEKLGPFVESATAELTLFRLDGRNSPFAKELLLPAEATSGVTTDYFQYALLIRNGQPARAWATLSGSALSSP